MTTAKVRALPCHLHVALLITSGTALTLPLSGFAIGTNQCWAFRETSWHTKSATAEAAAEATWPSRVSGSKGSQCVPVCDSYGHTPAIIAPVLSTLADSASECTCD